MSTTGKYATFSRVMLLCQKFSL